MSILINILLVIHVLISLLIILVVLMQRPKNEGLGAAFGGGMTDNLFGAQTTNVLQSFTRWLGGIFFLVTMLLAWLYVHQTSSSNVQRKLAAPTVPAPAPAVPAPKPDVLVEGGAPPTVIQTKPEAATAGEQVPAPAQNSPTPAPAPAAPNPAPPATPGTVPAGTSPGPAPSPAPAPAPAPAKTPQ